jgi:hypothetical protein
MAVYQRKHSIINAIQWTGSNRTDIENFFGDLDYDLGVIGLRFSTDDDRYDADDNPNIIQFDLWGDDQEVETEQWIVITGLIPDDDGQIMWNSEFQTIFEPAAPAADLNLTVNIQKGAK